MIIIFSVGYLFIRSKIRKTKGRNTTAPTGNSGRVYESASRFETDLDDDETKKACQSCGRFSFKEYKFCPYCGSTKFKTVEPSQPKSAKKIADKVNSDAWICGQCATSNELQLDNCKSCAKEFWPED